MPNSAAAKKRVRQAAKRTMRNRARKESLKKAIRVFDVVLKSGDKTAIGEGLKEITKAVDKAGDKGILHRNAVSRRKSRFARLAQAACK